MFPRDELCLTHCTGSEDLIFLLEYGTITFSHLIGFYLALKVKKDGVYLYCN